MTTALRSHLLLGNLNSIISISVERGIVQGIKSSIKSSCMDEIKHSSTACDITNDQMAIDTMKDEITFLKCKTLNYTVK